MEKIERNLNLVCERAVISTWNCYCRNFLIVIFDRSTITFVSIFIINRVQCRTKRPTSKMLRLGERKCERCWKQNSNHVKITAEKIQFSKFKITSALERHRNRFISPILRCPTSCSHSPLSACRRRNYFVKCNVNTRDYYCCWFSSNDFILFVHNPLGMNPGNFRCNIKWVILLVCAHTARLPALTAAEWRYPAFVCFRFVIAF